ncbi:MAG: DUF1320 family protein [Rhodobacteraceae bacterium]|jgi:phage gp36-like protein|nr:DUF1320 family protein [Paracoccaceae bacterium]
MPYASLQDLTDRVGARTLVDLTDRAAEPAGEIDADVVDAALAHADAVIDGYLAVRYALPLAETPPLLRDAAVAIALWKLHPVAPDPKTEADWREALRLLRDLSTGAARLAVAGVEPAGSGGQGARLTDRDRPMTEATLRGFI